MSGLIQFKLQWVKVERGLGSGAGEVEGSFGKDQWRTWKEPWRSEQDTGATRGSVGQGCSRQGDQWNLGNFLYS